MTRLPVHPSTGPLAGWIEKIAAWYTRWFGTPAAFAASLLALAVWVSFVPVLGPARWNAGPGLLGNTIESTGEWFFEVAILITGVTTAVRQREIESNQLHQMDRIEALEERLMQAAAENTALTKAIHEHLGSPQGNPPGSAAGNDGLPGSQASLHARAAAAAARDREDHAA